MARLCKVLSSMEAMPWERERGEREGAGRGREGGGVEKWNTIRADESTQMQTASTGAGGRQNMRWRRRSLAPSPPTAHAHLRDGQDKGTDRG